MTHIRGFNFNTALSIFSLCATPLFAEALDDERRFWCSLANARTSSEGEYQGGAINPEERRPTVFSVPTNDRNNIVYESFSEDGRYYYYVRNEREQQSKYVLHGVFDLQLLKLSTSSSWFFTDDDGLSRAFSRTNVWACTVSDIDPSNLSD